MITIPQTVTLAVGSAIWLMGSAIVKRVSLFRRYNLPAPVIGGLVFAIAMTILRAEGFEPPKFDTRLVAPLMIAFFASLGYGASIRDLKRGGRDVFYFLAVCTVLLVLQVVVGVVVAQLTGEPKLFGLMTSAVSLVGGPATALSFAPEFEKGGLEAAATIGVATAMLGIVTGGLIGSPVATILIRKQRAASVRAFAVSPTEQAPQEEDSRKSIPIDEIGGKLMYHIAWILIIGSVGYYLSQGMVALGVKLPFYVGAMIVAFVVRHLEETYGWFHLDKDWIEFLGGVSLTLFVSVSMMTLELWSIASVAGPLLLDLMAQAVLVTFVAVTVMYWFMGRDYDAAVTSGGMIGFMLGTTANAMATMSALTKRFGPAPRAFLVVPIVGACFIDFVNALVISVALTILS